MRFAVYLLSVLFSGICCAQGNVLFGDFPADKYQSSICFDKNGSLYPDVTLSNQLLRQHDNALVALFKNVPEEFQRISRIYQCSFVKFSETNFSILQDSIFQRKLRLLQSSSKDKSITFLIHGFRKPFTDTLSDWSSQRDYQQMRTALGNLKTFFIEVYWDAHYGCCFSRDVKRNKELFKEFGKAQENAVPVGENLRKFIASFPDKKLHLVTHSLGAKVALHAAFDSKLNHQHLKLLLVAPAVGEKEFVRQVEKISEQARCEIMVVYNRKDFVLMKKDNHLMLLGPGPVKYGETGLGCNHKRCITRIEKVLLKKNLPVTVSFYDLSAVGKCHHVRCYFTANNMNGTVKKFLE